MKNHYRRYSHCRFCGLEELLDIFTLKDSAPANAYIDPNNPHENERFPLVLTQCYNCGCTQLRDSVPGEVLFKNYKYSSSTIPSLVKHFNDYAKSIPLPRLSKILEIGSNDGVLLDPLKSLGHDVVGVEPAQNLADLANSKGLTTICNFFNESSAKEILERYGKFNVITSNNCFAHIDDIHSVIRGINLLLKDDGYLVFENAYLLDTVRGLYFDQCLTPGQSILTDNGLINIEDIDINNKVLTHLGNFKKVTHLFENNYNGDIIDIYSYGNSKPLSLTPEHPVYILRNNKKEFIEAKYIKRGDKLLKAAIKHNEQNQILKLSHSVGNNCVDTEYIFNVNESLCKIFGYFVAEGCYYECKEGSAQVDFCFGKSQSEKDLAEDCSKCLISHGAKGNIRWTEYGWHVTTYGAMARLLKREFNTGAYNKNLPGWIFNMDSKLCRIFIESYMKGDGYIYRNSRYLRGSTISENLAQGISLLANKVGYACSINIGKVLSPRKIANNKNISILKYNPIDILVRTNQLKKNKVYCDENYQYNLVKNTSIRKYKGFVYNIEVDNDNSYTMNQSSVHNCYHEHIFYHSIKPLSRLFARYGLEISNVEHNKNQGGSIRVFVNRPYAVSKIKQKVDIDEIIRKEEDAGLYNIRTYSNLNQKIIEINNELFNVISNGLKNKKTFSAFGAAAKFTTFTNQFNLDSSLLKYVVDDSQLKWGLLTPDNKIPIVSPEYFKNNPTDYCIITAWNFSDAIVNKNKWYTDGGGKFVICMPEVKIV